MRRIDFAAILLLSTFLVSPARAQSVDALRDMSIDQLASIDVSSVTKSKESLRDAPASIYVITHEDIVRSGAQTIPEILRLAPNLQVYQTSASNYVITARGMNGNSPDQAFANKLLVLIDGRSVYTPLYSGVYWDLQDLLPDDIERIEVISGPGATLWGANAVNGVINIITRNAAQTQGGLVDVSAGNLEQSIGLRYGGTFSDDLAYRFFFRDYFGDDTETSTGATTHDHWSRPDGGFRFDWTPNGADTVMLEGQDLAGDETNPSAADSDIAARNLTAHWTHDWDDGSSLQLTTYYDREARLTEKGGGNFSVDTYDFAVQQDFNIDSWNTLISGGEARFVEYNIHGTHSLFFTPSSSSLDLSDVFAQDSMGLTEDLTAILGLKFEDDPYSGWSPLPSGRLSWKVSNDTLLWASISRAVRSPTPFDEGLAEKAESLLFISGNPDFATEKLTAYEIGARIEPISQLTYSVSAFYNDYDDLRDIELTIPTLFPLYWGNDLKGYTYGFDSWGSYQLLPWWRLTASFDELKEHYQFKPGATDTLLGLGFAQIGDDPQNTASLGSSMNLGDVDFDAELRYVSKLPNPVVPAYVEANSTIAWNLSETMRIALSGFNLLHARHQELPAVEADAVPRSFEIAAQYRF